MKPGEKQESRSWHPYLVMLLAGVAIVAVGALRAPEGATTSLVSGQFWLRKVEQPPVYEMVLAGDSRVLCDLSPAAMSMVTMSKTLNFGFNFTGYESRYLDAVEAKLNPEARAREIVLGVTPRSLTPLNMRVSGFLEESERPASERWANRYLGGVLSRVRPFLLGSIAGASAGRTSARSFYPDGLMSVELNPPDPEFDLKTYRTIFVGNMVAESSVQQLLHRVRSWSDSGIRVYGFRPPVASRIFEAEESMSGFSEQRFVAGFEAAGGVWLRPDASGIALADGSHVTASSVPEFSRRLAATIVAARTGSGKFAPSGLAPVR
jgi:hypothetical protein